MMGQKKGKKAFYWGTKVLYPTLDFVLPFSGRGGTYQKFGEGPKGGA